MIRAIPIGKGKSKAVCIKIDVNGYEISISLDNSLGAFGDVLRRGEIRVFDGPRTEDDITEKVFSGETLKEGLSIIYPNVENLEHAIQWCKANKKEVK